MKVSDILIKDNNNLDIFRVIAAAVVIYGHAGALSPAPGWGDFLVPLVGFDYSGSLAVKVFFFLSGLVVTNSLITKRSISAFIISRSFRIMPALIALMLITGLIIGPLLTTLPVSQYFQDSTVYTYMFDNMIFQAKYELPGVFEHNIYAKAVNGSLWSLAYEVALYTGLLGLFLTGIFKNNLLLIIAFILILIDPLTGNKILFTYRPENREIDYLLPCFAIGSFFALYKDRINIGISTVVITFLLYYHFKASMINAYLFYLFLFVFILYISSRKIFLKLKPSSDISYGLYIWGFLVQQTLVFLFPNLGPLYNCIFACIISALIGWVSWKYIEYPSIRYGYKLIGILHNLNYPNIDKVIYPIKKIAHKVKSYDG